MKQVLVLPSKSLTLEGRVRDFLGTTRVGVDFGEAAGGIAVVRGNEILHAETYVDFHDATLETRRQLRRGRRTRHAKKIRLARLRSWVLRQEIPSSIPGARFKNGKSFLPDPYEVLKDKQYWVQPETYQIKLKGRDMTKVPTWADLAKRGDIDARAFVRALTLIFKKRGYKYDDQELEDFTNDRLEEFLNSCAKLNEAGELKDLLKAEVERRGTTKLRSAYEDAIKREPERRKALPRQVKENDLRQIIEAFGKRYGLTSETIERWKLNLAGGQDSKRKFHYGLLNKALRAARFDNRLRSHCSWCDKKTPRLKKPEVREKALGEAVENIRVYWNEFTKRTRSLTENEKKPFYDWYTKGLKAIPFPKGPKIPITDRTPTRENIAKYLEQIRAVKRPLRDAKGKWRMDFPMLAQLTDLLNRPPKRGRARLCMEHLRMASQGGFLCNRHPNAICKLEVDESHTRLDEVKIDPGRRKAPNPKREQHDLRVLKRLESILFVKGEKGEKAWRYGPISYITLEIPEPQTERGKKGQETERKVLSRRERLHRETGGICIYCGKTIPVEETELDHIVPRAKDGPDVQDNRIAACRVCNHPDTGKGDRLAREWLSGDGWNEFQKRVKSLKLPEFKETLLLLEKGATYPEDPTSLARVGARTGAFIYSLRERFKSYGVEPPTLEYPVPVGRPHIQIVRGRWTKDLRLSWLFKDKEAKQPNFPEKNRTDLYNHAQDAALVAATPPHTWRNQIFMEEAIRPCFSKTKQAKELRMRPSIALLTLAPDWGTFKQKKTSSIVKILGKTGITWRRQFMDQRFYQRPKDLGAPFLYIHKPLEKPSHEGQRRESTKVSKGGLVINVPHYDGTTGIRKVQVKPAHVAAVSWRDKKGKWKISRERIKPIIKFVENLFDPPIPKGAIRLGRLEQNQIIRLEDGFYRVKEFPKNAVIVIPENAITDALAKNLNIPKAERITPPERTLTAKQLAAFFEAEKTRNAERRARANAERTNQRN